MFGSEFDAMASCRPDAHINGDGHLHYALIAELRSHPLVNRDLPPQRMVLIRLVLGPLRSTVETRVVVAGHFLFLACIRGEAMKGGDMDRAQLERPFGAELVRSRKGAYGEVSYVEAVHYLRRLNEVFGAQWSWKLLRYEIRDADVLVHGSLSAGNETKEAFGGSNITVNGTTGQVVSVADDLKSAATDALKKACSLFGIGLDLHAQLEEHVPTTTDARVTAPLRSVPPAQGNSAPALGDFERNRLTAKQLKAIYAIAHGVGMTDGELRARSIEAYGVAVEFLRRADASSLIDALSSK
jgi:hypothetical protein